MKSGFPKGSLVNKLTARFVLIVTLSTVIVLTAGGWLLNRQGMKSLEALQRLEAEELAGMLGAETNLTPEQIRGRIRTYADSDYALYLIQIANKDGAVIFRSTNMGDAVIPPAPPGKAYWTVNIAETGLVGVVGTTTAAWDIKVGSALGPVTHVLDQYIRIGALMVAASALISLLSGYAFSRLAVAPLRAIERTASRIRADNLSERIAVPKGYAELEALAELLNRTFDRIESAFAQVRRFTTDASHELKTPLALVRLGAEKIRPRLAGDPEAEAWVADLIEETDHMQRIIDSLLFIAKADGGAYTIERKMHDMRPLVADFAEDARALAEDRSLRFELARNDAGSALVDPQSLRQLLLNLASNAIAATPTGGLITLSSERTEKGWRLAMCDEGGGVTPEMLERIFERFTRHHPSASTTGSGLGLPICRSIAGLYGGSIRAENRADRGGLRLVFEW